MQRVRGLLITIHADTTRTDIVSAVKHTDCESGAGECDISARAQAVAAEPCLDSVAPTRGVILRTICTEEDQRQTSERNHRFHLEVSLLDFQTSCPSLFKSFKLLTFRRQRSETIWSLCREFTITA